MRAEAFIYEHNGMDPLNQTHKLGFVTSVHPGTKTIEWHELIKLMEAAWDKLKIEYKEKLPFELV